MKNIAFKNNTTFRSCVKKVNSTLIDNAEELDSVMLMHNLLEYIQRYSVTSGCLWNYCKDKIDNINDNASDGKSFKYKTKIVERSENPGDASRPAVPTLNIEVTIPLKYLSKFCRFLDLLLINCEIELDFTLT